MKVGPVPFLKHLSPVPVLPPASPEIRHPFARYLPLFAILLAAAGLWLNTRLQQFPYYYHPDEQKKVAQILSGERNFNHPLLLLSASEFAWKMQGAPRENQRVVEIGRLVAALFCAAGTVAFALAAWFWRGPVAGAMTGVLLTANHQVFELAHYMKEDPALYFGTGLTALAMVGFWKRPGTWMALALGAALGIAVSGKYLGILLLVPVLALVWWGKARRKGPCSALIILALVTVFGMINFRLFTEATVFQKSFGKEMNWAIHGQKELTRQVPHAIYLNVFKDNTTPVIWLLLLVSLVRLWKDRLKPDRLAWCLWGGLVLWMLVLSFSPKTNDRYFLPLTGLIYLLAGAAAVHFTRRQGVLLLLVLIGVALDGSNTLAYWRAFQTDDRAELVAWLRKDIPPGETIAYDSRVNLPNREEYGDVPPLAQPLLTKTFVADLGSEEELRQRGVRYVITSESTYGRFFLDSLRPKEEDETHGRRQAFYRQLREKPPVWERNRGRVLYLHPGIEVYDIASNAKG